MRQQRWIKRGVGTILAAIAIVITAFPPPALPLRWLPAGFALVLAIMLFWEQRPIPDVPPPHADVLRGLGASAINDLNSRRPVQFPGTALESEQLHQSFRGHFPTYAKKLDGWNRLAGVWNESLLAIDHVAQEMANANSFQFGNRALSAAARANVNGVSLVPVAITAQPMADKTTVLLYGQNQIAVLTDPSAEQVTARTGQFRKLIGAVGTWPEVQHAQTIRLRLEALSKELLPEAARISMSHNVSVVSKCPICPKS